MNKYLMCLCASIAVTLASCARDANPERATLSEKDLVLTTARIDELMPNTEIEVSGTAYCPNLKGHPAALRLKDGAILLDYGFEWPEVLLGKVVRIRAEVVVVQAHRVPLGEVIIQTDEPAGAWIPETRFLRPMDPKLRSRDRLPGNDRRGDKTREETW